MELGKRKNPPQARNPRVAARHRNYDKQEERVKDLEKQILEMSNKLASSNSSSKLAGAKKTSKKVTEKGTPNGKKKQEPKRS